MPFAFAARLSFVRSEAYLSVDAAIVSRIAGTKTAETPAVEVDWPNNSEPNCQPG
jgi:hypothetical protein